MSRFVRIVKVGGSLLEQSSLPTLLARWLSRQSDAMNVFIAGGGKWVDAVRAADQRFQLSKRTSHWLSIQSMSITARLLADLLQCSVENDIYRLHVLQPSSTVVFDTYAFLKDDADGPDPLPESWDVTSDSIAARVALQLDAELVILKSIDAPESIRDAVAQGVVDNYFQRAVANSKLVRIENLLSY